MQQHICLSPVEVAKTMSDRGYRMTPATVVRIEQIALRKLASDPVLRQLAKELGNNASTK